MRWARFVCGALLLVGLGTGCAPRPLVRHDWRHGDGIGSLLEISAADLSELGDLRAEAGITYSYGGRRERGAAVLLFSSPDRLRLEVRGPLYTPVFTALLDGDSLTVVARGGAFKGAARGPLLLRLTDIDLGLCDLRHALLGLVEPGRIDTNQAVEYPRADRAIVPLRADGLRRRLWVDLQRGLATREELALPDGYVLLRRELQQYRRVGDAYLPHRVEIHQGEAVLVLEYREYVTGPAVPAASFAPGVPPDQVQRVD